jgi:tetratricopeptide (TPR) repeat protein
MTGPRRIMPAPRLACALLALLCLLVSASSHAGVPKGAPAAPWAGLGAAAPSETGLWSQADAMVNRLLEERRKLDLLEAEIERLRFMGEDFRDLQLYPTRVTGLGPEDDVRLDRMIEEMEKNLARTFEQIREMEKPLEDAFFIAGEMLQESPNRDMIDLILKDNVERIGRIVAVQKDLNQRWDEAFSLLTQYRVRLGLPAAARGAGLIEDDFFKVLLANTGRASQRFYSALGDYKDSVAARCGKADWERMASIDLRRIQGRMRAKSIDMVQYDLERLSARFQGRISIGVVDYYLGTSLMVGGMPLKAAEAYDRVGRDSRMHGPASLGVLQALFESHQDDSVLVRYRAFLSSGALDVKLLQPARYLAVQSAYFLGADSAVEAEVLSSGVKGGFHFKSLFVYAKSLVRNKRYTEARGVLAAVVAESNLDRGLRNRAELALAHLNFEEGFHERALKGYQALLDQSGMQAEALYGMVWCNIRMGDLEASEFILRKLITQYPDNPWAIEGFMVLIRKLMAGAKEEWAFRMQVDREAAKLKEYEGVLARRMEEKLISAEQAAAVRAKLERARAALSRQRPHPVEDVAKMYQQAIGLVDFVEERYRTGEYSEVSFNREREAVLAKLADAGRSVSDTAVRADSSGFRKEIKRKLFESRALGLDIHLMHKAWLEELLRYSQMKTVAEMAALKAAAETGADPAAAAKADSAREAERRRLAEGARLLADDISERLAGKADDILRRIREVSEDPNSAAIRDWLLFQKGYLAYTVEENALRKKLASRDWLDSRGGGDLAGLAEPIMDPDAYESPWLELVERHAESPYVPAALYYLGFTRTARGEYLSGLRHFEELSRRFPGSPYSQQALVFIGEYYFNENELDKAEAAYDRVLDYADSKYFDQALYKLAWTRYRQSSYKGAISSFTYILEENSRKQDRNKAVLTTEALQFAALSIAESDTSGDGGLRQSKAFADKLGDARLGARLLHRMAVIYTQQGKLDRAKRALESLLAGYPEYERIPEAMMELGRAYEKEQNFERAAQIRERIFRLYNRKGEWYAKLSREAKVNADSVAEAAMDQVALHYMYEARQIKRDTGVYASASESNRRRETYFRKAISAYDAYLQIYPESGSRAKYNYQQAEAYYALDEFGVAARKYMEVSRMGDEKLRQAAAFNAIVAAQELLKAAEEEARRRAPGTGIDRPSGGAGKAEPSDDGKSAAPGTEGRPEAGKPRPARKAEPKTPARGRGDASW